MFKYVFALFILCLSTAFSQTCTTRDDVRLDRGNRPFANYQSTGQGSFETCFAHAAAALYRSINPSSPQILPESLAMNAAHMSNYLVEDGEDETISGGEPHYLLQHSRGKNVCRFRDLDESSDGYRAAAIIDQLKYESIESKNSESIRRAMRYLAHQIGTRPILSRREIRNKCQSRVSRVSGDNLREIQFFQDFKNFEERLRPIKFIFNRNIPEFKRRVARLARFYNTTLIKMKELRSRYQSAPERIIRILRPINSKLAQIRRHINSLRDLNSQFEGEEVPSDDTGRVLSITHRVRTEMYDIKNLVKSTLDTDTVKSLLKVNLANTQTQADLRECTNNFISIGYYFPEVVCNGSGGSQLERSDIDKISRLVSPLLWNYSNEESNRSFPLYDIIGPTREDAFGERLLNNCQKDVPINFNVKFNKINLKNYTVNKTARERRISRRKRRRSLRTVGRELRRNKAFSVSLCSRALTREAVPGYFYRSSQVDCGPHEVTVIGQRCRRGRMEYLVLNSQSLNCNIYPSGSNARRYCAAGTGKTWIDENTLSNISYGVTTYTKN